jgi:hypothetical protein
MLVSKMLARLEENDHRALDSLSKQPVWHSIEKLLRAERDVALKRLVLTSDMSEVHRLQGRVQSADEFLKAVADAPEALKRAAGAAR